MTTQSKPDTAATERRELEPSWRSDKAHEAICESAERIANHYCDEDDTYFPEVKRLTVAISAAVDSFDTVRALEAERDALREALQLIQGFDWQFDDSPHGQEIKRRALAALGESK